MFNYMDTTMRYFSSIFSRNLKFLNVIGILNYKKVNFSFFLVLDSLDGVSSNSNMSTTANMGMGMSPSMGISSMAQMGSPPDIKPDINSLVSQSFYPYGIQHPMSQSQASPGSQPMMSPGLHSPSSSVTSPSMMSIGSPGSASSPPGSNPHMPHSNLNSKHICAICGDRASGKHYGVYRYTFKTIYCIRCYAIILIFQTTISHFDELIL